MEYVYRVLIHILYFQTELPNLLIYILCYFCITSISSWLIHVVICTPFLCMFMICSIISFFLCVEQNSQPKLEAFQDLLNKHPNIFYPSRTAKSLLVHWQLLKQYYLLDDQSGEHAVNSCT